MSVLAKNDGIITAIKEQDEKWRRRLLWLLLLLLLLSLCSVSALFARYIVQPAPLPEILPLPIKMNYSPHYLFSIYGVEKPVGVALSPRGDRIYVAETGGERMIKIFDRDGNPLGSLTPPRIGPGERSPVYLATDSAGRVFVTDRVQHAIFVYDSDGTYLDTVLSPDLTLSAYVSKHVGDVQTDIAFAYNVFEPYVYYKKSGEMDQTLPAPAPAGWSPLGVRIDGTDNMLLTNVAGDLHAVYVTLDGSWQDSTENMFGAHGQGNGQFSFPNAAVTDSRGRIHVTDSNNGRISVWDEQGNFLSHFGQGAGSGALSLPRGAAIDRRNRLHVVDTVGQSVKVYDVSGTKPHFLFAFGDWGLDDGQFNYPNDIALDATSRLYIADRENNRIQVWSY